MSAALDNVIIVGNSSDDPFAIDLAFGLGQSEDIADLISMKTFANLEFCPRFISDEDDLNQIGVRLRDKTVVIVSTSSMTVSRQNLAMQCLPIARAAKENGAAEVVLVEPDLYYSAQDRGPRPELGKPLRNGMPKILKNSIGNCLPPSLRRDAETGRGGSSAHHPQPLVFSAADV